MGLASRNDSYGMYKRLHLNVVSLFEMKRRQDVHEALGPPSSITAHACVCGWSSTLTIADILQCCKAFFGSLGRTLKL